MKELIASFFLKFGIKFTEHKGGRELLFRCPFHDDRKPSMWMNTTSGKYHCFACQAGGHSLAQFIKRLTGETIKIEDYLTEIDNFNSMLKQIYERSTSNILANQSAFEFMKICENEFYNFSPVFKNELAYNYLKEKRKLSDATIKKFKLKYATDGDYKNRIIIPYYKGTNLVGFNSRLMAANKEFLKEHRYRYLVNNSEFSDYVYGLENVTSDDYVILVEGPFDLMYVTQCGFRNVISTLTTRITPSHYFKFSDAKKIIFCFDNDENKKGYEGALKSAKMIHELDSEKPIYIMRLPDFKDPNECTIEELEQAKKKLRRLSFEKRNLPIFNVIDNIV